MKGPGPPGRDRRIAIGQRLLVRLAAQEGRDVEQVLLAAGGGGGGLPLEAVQHRLLRRRPSPRLLRQRPRQRPVALPLLRLYLFQRQCLHPHLCR